LGLVVFDQARNELVKALAAATEEEPPTLVAVRSVLRLSPRAAKQLRKELQELLERLHFSQKSAQESARGSKSRTTLRRYSLTLALVPTEPGTDDTAPG
jgi:uroporphyrinogen-III synthase